MGYVCRCAWDRRVLASTCVCTDTHVLCAWGCLWGVCVGLNVLAMCEDVVRRAVHASTRTCGVAEYACAWLATCTCGLRGVGRDVPRSLRPDLMPQRRSLQSPLPALVSLRRVIRKRIQSFWSELVLVTPSRTHLVKQRDVGLICVPGEGAGDARVPAPRDPEALVGPLFQNCVLV